MTNRRHHSWIVLTLAALVLTLGTGCPVVSNLPAPGRTLQQKDPEQHRDYLLYVPTHYNANHAWPLVVTCHGTRYYDTARRQFDEWKGLAEQKNFLLLAPELNGTSGDFVPAADEQVRRQLGDEAAILSVIRATHAAYNIDPARIFLTGWSAGGYAVLFTGLRNPDVFRALSCRQPNFNPAFVEMCIPFLDHYQSVQIMYGNLDPLKNGATAAIDWLRAHEFEPTTLERPGSHKRDPQPVYEFFAQVVRNSDWVRVQTREDENDPMKVTLSVRSSFEPVKYLWDFGDGTPRMPVASPEHTYAKAGLYNVRVGLWRNDKDHVVRQRSVQVPRIRLGTVK